MAATKSRRKNRKNKEARKAVQKEIFGIALITLALLLFIGLMDLGDGTIGKIGAALTAFLRLLAGEGALAFPILMLFIGVMVFMNRESKAGGKRITGLVLLFLSLLAFLHMELALSDFRVYMQTAWQGAGGGLLGGLLSYLLRMAFGDWGGIIILSALSIIGLLLLTQIPLSQVFVKLGQGLSRIFSYFKAKARENAPPKKEKKQAVAAPPVIISHEDREAAPVILSHEDRVAPASMVVSKEEAAEVKEPITPPLNKFAKNFMPSLSSKRKTPEAPPADISAGMEKPAAEMEGSFSPAPQEKAGTGEDPALAIAASPSGERPYQLPTPDLVTKGVKIKNPRMNKAITDAIVVLEDTLESFGVKAKVSQVVAGPAVTRYELQPAPGVKVSRITSLSDDIALSLAAPEVRIEAPIPGKSAVGIEVPRPEISTVYFRDVIESPEFINSASKLSQALGKNISGEPIVGDLSKMPHLLIAGATGSGKSICINSIICSILYKANPQEVKFMLIDPKKVELAVYNDLPHLLTPVVTDNKKAANALKWVVKEMEDRYSLFAAGGVKDFRTYNERHPEGFLPQIVVIIDELADLMMVAPADVEESICRLAQMARAAGIHLIVATQRPSVDVITGLIKANIPSRIAFAVSSHTDSRTILDMGGAEKLLGRGDMLYHPVGIPKPIRLQGTFIDEKDIKRLVEYCRHQAAPQFFPEEEIQAAATEISGQGRGGEDYGDELFYDAARLVIETGQASTSFLQRRFRIGNPRAGRIMDILEEHGVVSGPDGSKPRNVLISMEQFQERFEEGA